MSNRFGEDKWSAEQVALDSRVLAAFDALEASLVTALNGGAEQEEWVKRKATKEEAKEVIALADRLESFERREHWAEQLARLGFTYTPKSPAPEPEPTTDPGAKTVEAKPDGA